MTDYRPYSGQQPAARRSWLGILLLPLIAFLLGLAAMAWLLTRWDQGARYLGIVQPPAAAQPAPAPVVQPLPTPAPVVPQAADPALQQRLESLEQRFGQIENLSATAVGNADRTEGLLVALATRRALDRGVPLGYIEGLLRRRFGQSEPQAVGTIIAAARQPVTLEELQEGLAETAPSLTGGNDAQSWWTAVRTELGGLVTIRKAGSPSTQPQERVARATRRLESGQVDVALAEILRLPARDRAAAWIVEARRYVAARRALDTIETNALLESQAQAQQTAL